MAAYHPLAMSSIHILDDDSLLNVFHLYRPTPFDEDKTNNERAFGGEWIRERWWYKHTSAKDGGSLYLGPGQHPTLVFASFARIAHL